MTKFSCNYNKFKTFLIIFPPLNGKDGHSSLFKGRQVGDSRHCASKLWMVLHTWLVEAILPHHIFPRFDKTRGDLKDYNKILERGILEHAREQGIFAWTESTNQIVVPVEFSGVQAERDLGCDQHRTI